MRRSNRTTFLVAIAACLALGACKNKREIHNAKHSVYDTDFAVVYSAALAATRELYTQVDDFPGNGVIKTAWHQVSYANNQDDLSNQRTVAQSQGLSQSSQISPAQAAAGMPTRLAYKRHFIRFDVSVAGGRPWRVKVVGHAAEWEPGNAVPTELRGMARPPWLDGRTEALQVAIYRRIKPYAKPAKEEVIVETGPKMPKTDPSSFTGVPAPAAAQLAKIKDALARRDYAVLRTTIAEDVAWSLGGAPGADTAMAMWQADPEPLDAMAAVLAAGCAAEDKSHEGGTRSSAEGGAKVSDKRVACPAGPPLPGTYQLVLEARGADWLVTSFLKAE